jgi:glycosyltransferase involved in cell wall biosynthesis
VRHLIISREYPPAAYAPGGIGTYVANIARLLAERGETVHVIGQRWEGAPAARESFVEGRLVVHRIGASDLPPHADPAEGARLVRELDGLKKSDFPAQWFSWHAAQLAERLIAEEGIDVIEGQEWEAPLYHLLLRRALGLGPARTPPCIVHHHSASAVIRRYNGAPETPRDYPTMARMEAFCIRASDAHLCPSHYYAGQVAAHFRLSPDSIRVIPLPVGSTPFIARCAETWENGSICFVGRLEPRKGIIEWMAAAERVAKVMPDVNFDFVGADIWKLQQVLEKRLAPTLRRRFRFHGSKSREEVLAHLAKARAATVPSRWENFPNVCLEAMRTGLPVIATRLGGMVQLVEDGRTGWLTPDTGVAGMTDGLAEALGRCLATPAKERAAMGLAASQTVARICDNDSIANAHLAYRAAVAEQGSYRSRSASFHPVSAPAPRLPAATAHPSGTGIVIWAPSARDAQPVLGTLEHQTLPPSAIALVCAEAAGEIPGVLCLHRPELQCAAAWNAGHAALRDRKPGFWLFLDEHDRLAPSCLARMQQILVDHPEVGLIAPWTFRGEAALEAPPIADLTHQLVQNDCPPATAIRDAALGADPPFRPGMPREFDIWDLANRVLAQGWAAASLPEALAERQLPPPRHGWPDLTALRAIRGELLAPLESQVSPITVELIDLYVPLQVASSRPDSLESQASPAALEPVDLYVPPQAASSRPAAKSLRRYLKITVLEPQRAIRAIIRRMKALEWRSG